MELAGVACAEAFMRTYPDPSTPIYVFVGPGNNGGDGLVAARHLALRSYPVTIVLPKEPKQAYFASLVSQAASHGCQIVTSKAPTPTELDANAIIIDALFGFSFSGPPRPPYDEIIELFSKAANPVFSIDVPSGWPLDSAPPEGSWLPETVISLTAPKLCMRGFEGRHWLGGRFVPPKVAQDFGLVGEFYEAALKESHVVDITSPSSSSCREPAGDEVMVVYVTAPGAEAAEALASALLAADAVACCNLSPVKSMYTWKGKVEKDDETLMMMKTRRGKLEDVKRIVKEVHEYDVPEVIAVEVKGGSDEYLNWVRDETK